MRPCVLSLYMGMYLICMAGKAFECIEAFLHFVTECHKEFYGPIVVEAQTVKLTQPLQSDTCRRVLCGVLIWRWFVTLHRLHSISLPACKIITFSYIKILHKVWQKFLGLQSWIWSGEPCVSQTYTSGSLIHQFGHSLTIIIVVGSLSLIHDKCN